MLLKSWPSKPIVLVFQTCALMMFMISWMKNVWQFQYTFVKNMEQHWINVYLLFRTCVGDLKEIKRSCRYDFVFKVRINWDKQLSNVFVLWCTSYTCLQQSKILAHFCTNGMLSMEHNFGCNKWMDFYSVLQTGPQ